ncbi:MAG: DUF1922 domain-containing protein [Candidatus Bathyarchaeota archaeon]|nr:DUF1922 domain-containing protein [Candidatus Bathyarchaeota archaeon]MCX8162692.1 DUF1922 domain-containing protein [Candidatus Bathyarchaeota archaeon]
MLAIGMFNCIRRFRSVRRLKDGFLIVRCPYCGNLSIARAGSRTRSCSFCGKRFSISSVNVLRYVANAREASELTRRLKKRLRV